MWDDAYKKEQEDIKAPEFLKVKTQQKMAESRQKHRRFFAPKLMLGLSFGFLAVVLAFNFFNTSENDAQLVTDLTFERIEGAGLRFGVTSDDGAMTLVEVERALDVAISDWKLSVFYLQDVSWQVDGEIIRMLYEFENDESTLRLMVNNQTTDVSTNSILNDRPLALYYRIMLVETIFIAEFLIEDIYYQLEVTGLTEEEMVQLLKEIFNFFD